MVSFRKNKLADFLKFYFVQGGRIKVVAAAACGCMWAVPGMAAAEDVIGNGVTDETVNADLDISNWTVMRIDPTWQVNGSVYGAYKKVSNDPSAADYGTGSYTVTLQNNNVSLNDGANVSNSVFGANVVITGYDRPTETYILSGNKVIITGNVNVAYTDNKGAIAGASINCSTTDTDKRKVKSITVENNTVEIDAGDSAEFNKYNMIVGGATGIADTSITRNNKVIIKGGNFNSAKHTIAGGFGPSYMIDDNAQGIGNSVEISGGNFKEQIIFGAYRNLHEARNNTVNISGGTFAGGATHTAIIGGDSYNNGIADSNAVTISGGTFTDDTHISGGSGGDNSIVTGNTVAINGGTFTGKMEINGGLSGTNGTINNNTVTISGGDFSAVTSLSVKGGEPFSEGITQNNIVNILTSLNMETLYGGMGETSTGNTLNIGAKNNSTNDLYGFQNINFLLPADTANGDTMLTVNSGYQTNLTGVTFGVSAPQGLNLNVGEKVTLITNNNGLLTDSTLKTVNNLTVPTSISADTTFSIEKEGTESIIVTVKAPKAADGKASEETKPSPEDKVPEETKPSPEVKVPEEAKSLPADKLPERTKSLPETRIEMTSVINNGADFLVSRGLDQAAIAAETDDIYIGKGARIYVPFAAIGGGSLKVDSGSNLDSRFYNIDLGLARKLPNSRGTLLLGPVFEYGRGGYDSYLDSGVHGWGDCNYFGGGFFAKQSNKDGFYYEGSLRVGQVKADYMGNLATGLNAWFDTKSTYLAAHAKVGKIFTLKNADTVNAYFKYLYSRIGSDDVTVGSTMNSENYHFDPVTSHRLQLGFRYTHVLNKMSNLYGGLAWQYEFDGEARAAYNGVNTPSPSLKGSSGLLEIGWQVKPSTAPVTLDLGLTGWFGKQQGVTGGLKVDWEF